MKTTTPQPYKAHLTPHLDMQRDLKFGGAWFEVCIDCDEPDDQCLHCRGDGMDPDCDYLLPCPDCGGIW